MPSPLSLQALESLKRLSGTSYQPTMDSSQTDPSVQRIQLAQQREDELKDRLIANQRAQAASAGIQDPGQAARSGAQYGGEVTALKNLLGDTQQDIQENPITAQRAQVEDITNRQRGAMEQGFGGTNPIQEQALYAKKQAETKLQQPMDIARLNAEGDLAKQQEASRGALGVAQEQSRGGLDIQRNFTDFQRSLTGQSGTPGQGLPQSVTMPGRYGGGTINMGAASSRLPKPVPPAITQAITVARRNYETAKQNEGMFSGGGASQAAKAALDQAIAAGIYNYPVSDPAHKQFVQAILNDPQAAQLPLDQILQMKGETDVTPDEMAELQDMLNLFRGF